MIRHVQLAPYSQGDTSGLPLYVRWCEKQRPSWVHSHSFVELVIVLLGSGKHCGGQQIRVLKAGDVVVIPSGLVHFYKDTSEDFSLVNLIYQPEMLPLPQLDACLLPGFTSLLHGTPEDGDEYLYSHLNQTGFSQVHELAVRLQREDLDRQPGYRFTMLGIFMQLLSIIARESTLQSRKKAPVLFRTAGVITYLNRHFREKCDSAELCRIAGMSRSSLQRYFLNATGCSPRQYLLQLRIAEAANLLRSTGKSIDEISEETGFGDRNYFSRQFRKITGQTPASCRKLKKSGGAEQEAE